VEKIRLEIYRDPQRERVWVDGVEVADEVLVELAFMDAAAEMSIKELVQTFGARGKKPEVTTQT
jgi:hypothetical protein